MKLLVTLLGLIVLASSTVYFQEDFSDPNWESRWVVSTKRPAVERGKLELDASKYATDKEAERGLKTAEDARYYTLSAKFPEFTNANSPLVLQYSLTYTQSIDCGGAYVKLHPKGLDQVNYDGDSAYNIMFGPDQCGGTKRVHAILSRDGTNHLTTKQIYPETDLFTHTYTFILRPDNTYEVLIDGDSKAKGPIEDDWTILPPKQIQDPSKSKPSDWQDNKYIDDPEDKKPEGWDEIPQEILDPEAKKPEDWDDELDGEWEAPKVPNPEYKGVWRPKQIENPKYQGEWVHPMIPNPEYKPVDDLYKFSSFEAVGLELWQVKAGSIFDNFLVTDDEELAAAARKAIDLRREKEKKNEALESAEAAKKAAEEAEKEKEHDHAEEEKEDL
jgi:calreticulin